MNPRFAAAVNIGLGQICESHRPSRPIFVHTEARRIEARPHRSPGGECSDVRRRKSGARIRTESGIARDLHDLRVRNRIPMV